MDKLRAAFSLESLENRQLLADAHLGSDAVFLIFAIAASATAAGAAGLAVGLYPMMGMDYVEVGSLAATFSIGIMSFQFACIREKGEIPFLAMNVILSTTMAGFGLATGIAASTANWAYSTWVSDEL